MKKILITVMAILLPLSVANAETPEEKGLKIATEIEARDNGYGDMTADMEMILVNKHGDKSVRQMTISNLEVPGDGDKGLSVFLNPKDIKGTALLTYSHKVGLDDQWLWLPALKRVKRISSSNKSGSFMGSEFAFEDISSFEVEKYTYKFLREETYEGKKVFVLEADPVDESSGYKRQLAYIDVERYIPLKTDFYDRKDSFLKTLTYEGYKQYGKYWRPDSMNMINHQTGKSTTLSWTNYKFNTGLKDSDFTQNALKRAR